MNWNNNIIICSLLYNLKKRDEGKAMICLVNDCQMLKSYIPKISISQLSYLNSKIPTT